MTDRGRSEIRQSILGADRAFKVIPGGAGTEEPPVGASGGDEDPCPVRALGYNDHYHFLDTRGWPMQLSAPQLVSRAGLLKLFGGDDGENSWLRRNFPRKKDVDDGNGGTIAKVVDFQVNAAAAWLMRACSQAGIWGSRMQLRQPGIWRGDDGLPIVHCGDRVLIAGEWQVSGSRQGSQIFIAAEPTPRPDTPCDKRIGEKLQQEIQDHWRFRSAGGGVATLGLIAIGHLSGALRWRMNGLVSGESGSGKSALRDIFRACWPVHDYSNDTSKAGMEQTIAGRAIPAVIDEANDRNKSAGTDLIDLVLSSSGDEGTKLARGTTDGRGRTATVVSSVVMFSINLPPLQPQHLGRFVVIDLGKPEEGADFRGDHERIRGYAKEHARALWGRSIASAERYEECLARFRIALRDRGCSPREMDGKGAILAGWWILTHEGLPDELGMKEAVGALGEYVVTTRQAVRESGPLRALRHLLGFPVTMFRSTDREAVGILIDQAFGVEEYREPPPAFGEGWQDAPQVRHTPASAAELLGRIGVRPVRRCEATDDDRARRGPRAPCYCRQCWNPRQRKLVPRCGPGDQLWILSKHSELDRIFANSDFDGGRWAQELMRLEGAAPSGRNIRIGGVPGPAIWLPRSALPEEEPEPD